MVLALAQNGPTPWLADVPAGCNRADLLDILLGLGFMRLGKRGRRSLKKLTPANRENLPQYLKPALDCLKRWPDSINEIIEAEKELADSRHCSFGALKSFGGLYLWLSEIPDSEARRMLIDHLRNCASSDPAIAALLYKSKLLAVEQPVGTLLNMTQATKKLGKSWRTLDRIIRAGGLSADVIQCDKNRKYLISTEAIRLFNEQRLCSVDMKYACNLLHVSKRTLRRLAELGIILRNYDAYLGLFIWSIDRIEIDNMLKLIEEAPILDGITLRGATLMLSNRHTGLTAEIALKHAFEGAIRYGRNPTAKGLNQFVFHREDFQEWLKTLSNEFADRSSKGSALRKGLNPHR